MAPIFIVTPAFLAGIFITGWLGVAAIWLGIGASGSFALLLFAYFYNRRYYYQPEKHLVIAWPLALLAFCMGGLRLLWAAPSTGTDGLLYYTEQGQVRLVGVISGEPTYTERGGSFRLSVRQLYVPANSDKALAVAGDVFVRATPNNRYEAGDLLEVVGKLELPQEISGDGFPYRDYLARQGIYVSMSYPRLQLLDTKQEFFVLQILGDIRRSGREVIRRFVPGEEGDLLAGILLGDQREIDPETKAAFRSTGTSHIVAISGANITITISLVLLVMMDFFRLQRRKALIIALMIVVGYVILVGASPSVVRAGLMGVLVIGGWLLGREYAALSGLCGAALLMTIYQPNTLWDIGFQLSFLATLGLVLVAQPLQEHPLFKNLPLILQESVVLTIAAQVTTLPLMMFYFKQVSLIFLAANILALPALPMVMVTGALAVGAGWLFGEWLPTLAAAFGWVAWIFLAYMLWIVKVLAAVPFANAALPAFHPIWLVYYYGGLALLIWHKQDEKKRLWNWLRNLTASPLALISLISLNLGVWLLVIFL